MDNRSSSDPPIRRRDVLAGTLALGAAVAGCTAPRNDKTARIEALEERIAELEAELEAEREHSADGYSESGPNPGWGNIWGFSAEELETLQQQADRWTDSVLAIDVFTDAGRWSAGTGWLYDESTVVTNAHVVRPQRLPDADPVDRYTVWTRTGDSAEGELLGHTYGNDDIFDSREDIGFLEVPTSIGEERVVDRGVSRDLEADEPLVQVGHPWSLEYWTASIGPFISHRDPFFTTNIPGQPGVSGSPVFDLDGDVVGMTWGGLYTRVPQRDVDEAPPPGDGRILSTFDDSVNGIHSYMHRIDSAYEALT